MRPFMYTLSFICLSFLGIHSVGFADPATPPQAQVQNQAHDQNQVQADQVDLNTANASELKTLKGIGKKLAQRIVDDRKANGPFASVDDLKRVRGIGKKTVEKNRDRMRVSFPKPSTPNPGQGTVQNPTP